jgi:nucleoid-associated protein YgaU
LSLPNAPLSTCLKLRLGPCEWTHTVRASDETELRARFSEFRALVHDMAAELNELALHLEASHVTLREALERKRAEAKAAPAFQETAAASPTPDALQQAVAQAVQAVLAAQQAAPNGQPQGHANGQAKRHGKPADQETGWCSLHDCAMEERQNDRGTWFSHVDDDGRYCKGARR